MPTPTASDAETSLPEPAGLSQAELLQTWEKDSALFIEKNKLQPNQTQFPPELPLGAAVQLFLATLKGQSVETAKTYRVGCRRFMWFLHATSQGNPAEQKVETLSPLVLEEFYLWLVDTYGRKARSTCSGYLAATRNLFEYLARRRLTPGGCQYQEMVAGLSKLQGRASYKTPRVRTRQIEQVVKLAATSGEKAAPNSTGKPQKAKKTEEILRRQLEELRDRAIILTLFTTGMRRQEVASLNRSKIELLRAETGFSGRENGSNLANQSKTTEEIAEPGENSEWQGRTGGTDTIYELIITGKGQKERLVYFDLFTLEAIGEYLELRGKDKFQPLFLQHHRGRDKINSGANGEAYRVSLVTVWQAVKKFAGQLGVEVKPHDFRHNLATTLLNAGAQLSEVQDILGHASPTTTKQIYAHYDRGHLRSAFSRFRKSAAELG